MRRLCAILTAALAVAAALAAVLGAPADSASTYRVDAIFDTAKGVIPGQLVKIAGARVGTIDDVELTKDYKARIVMAVPRRFAFHDDASCNIQPEGLISENFVQCDPGTPSKPELGGTNGKGTPTVPVQRTMVPVSITDLFRIFQADVRQRFTVAIAAIGGGLAARGPDLNNIIRRSNPTLMAVRKLTKDLAAQKAQLSSAVADTDKVVGSLAKRKGRVQDFIVQAKRVTAQTADHRTALADAIRRLPALLDQTDVAVGELNRFTVEGRPLLGQLRAAAPGLERAVDQLAPFSAAARPALRRLSTTADIGRRAAKHARPVVRLLRTFTADALPVGRLLADALVSLRQRGFVEQLNLFAYYAAAAGSRFDATSHVIPAHIVLTSCSIYAQTPKAGCNAFYGADRATRKAAARKQRTGAHGRPQAPGAAPVAGATPAPAVPVAGRPPNVTDVLKPVQDLTKQITDQVLGKLPPLGQVLGGKNDPQSLQDLTDFLLGK